MTKSMTRSEAQVRAWADPAIRKHRIDGLRRKWRTDVVYAIRVKTKLLRWIASPDGQAHLSENGKRTILLGRKGNPSRPEQALAALLKQRGIPFEAHVRYKKWVCDFVLPGKIILEVDSERFHQKTRARDAQKDAYLRSLGFTVRRLDATKVLRTMSRGGQL